MIINIHGAKAPRLATNIGMVIKVMVITKTENTALANYKYRGCSPINGNLKDDLVKIIYRLPLIFWLTTKSFFLTWLYRDSEIVVSTSLIHPI